MVIGIVILSGVLSATVFTLFVVPVAYSLLSKKSRTPEEVGRILEKEQAAIWQRVNLINFAFIAIKASSVYPNFHSSESFVAYLQAQSTGSNVEKTGDLAEISNFGGSLMLWVGW